MNKTEVIFPLKVYETFAGIGSQHKALTSIDKSKKYFKVIKTSEWDAMAIIAYAQIHNKIKFEKKLHKINKMNEKDVLEYFNDKTFSLNSKTPANITSKNIDFLRNLMAANIANSNYPDIANTSGKLLTDVDLLTYSFPCQGLSIANMGRDKGMNEKSQSTSSLIWQIRRMLLEAIDNNIELPKYLLMENVKHILSKKHKDDYLRWVKFLKELGYITKTIVLNGLNHGALQRRERVFAISVLNWTNDMSDKEFKDNFDDKYNNTLSIKQRKKMYYEILSSSDEFKDEINSATPNPTSSRLKMVDENCDLMDREWRKGLEYTFNTLTTKQDRHPNIGMIKLNNPINAMKKRFITPREGYQIMGYDNEDFSAVKIKYDEGHITKEALYRQAGNSIVVSVLEDIFKYIKDIEWGRHEI
ncbi:DNA (cytosine-5-)-methyltransferase [Candidatus Mycoplasma mahonii]|uniref:DNA (cytosine-5-)-methyltransferase n=1 Tax=Candidatus Mycoplasma mahonii TaxID=3004105 RepID=UPI0026F25AAA|nr:DNA (cytosine-5-)-methyltransferase [Candidatus Mycoplasma mahonii]WKX02774.1 DNA (cytosine-5-)-methyltransferase [Candidatus Mycoplasma mahonii]